MVVGSAVLGTVSGTCGMLTERLHSTEKETLTENIAWEIMGVRRKRVRIGEVFNENQPKN